MLRSNECRDPVFKLPVRSGSALKRLTENMRDAAHSRMVRPSLRGCVKACPGACPAGVVLHNLYSSGYPSGCDRDSDPPTAFRWGGCWARQCRAHREIPNGRGSLSALEKAIRHCRAAAGRVAKRREARTMAMAWAGRVQDRQRQASLARKGSEGDRRLPDSVAGGHALDWSAPSRDHARTAGRLGCRSPHI